MRKRHVLSATLLWRGNNVSPENVRPKVPLSFIALASQKSGMVLHFLCFYGHPTLSTWFTNEYKKSGKKLDMGKGCVRFKKLDDLALDVVGRTVARVSEE